MILRILFLLIMMALTGAVDGWAIVNRPPPSATTTSATTTIDPNAVIAGPIDNVKDMAAASQLDWLGTCWMCPVFKILNDTRESFTQPACDYVASQVVTLVPITIGIFMMISAAMMLLPFGPAQSASTILATVFNRTILMIVVALLIYDCSTFNNYITGPIYKIGLNAAKTTMDLGISTHTAFGLKTDCVDPIATGSGTEASFYCMLEVASKTIGVPIRLGMNVMADIQNRGWWDVMTSPGGPWVILQSLMAGVLIALGMMVVVFYFMLNVDFALYTAIFEVLSSFYILMFLHPTTRGFALSSLKGLFASAVALFLAAIVLTAQIAIIVYIIDVQPDLNSVEDVAKYIIDNGVDDASRGFGDPVFLMLIAGQLIINAAMMGVSRQAQALVSAGSNIGIPQLGGDFAQKFQERIQTAARSFADTTALGAYSTKLTQENMRMMQPRWKAFQKSGLGKALRFTTSPVGSAARWAMGKPSPKPRTEA